MMTHFYRKALRKKKRKVVVHVRTLQFFCVTRNYEEQFSFSTLRYECYIDFHPYFGEKDVNLRLRQN